MALKGAIFDLDGVIVSTVSLHFNAWKKMFGEYGREFTFQDYKDKVDGIPRIDGARAILTDLTPEELDKAATKKQGYFLEHLASETIEVYESTFNLVHKFKDEGIKVSVISSSKNCLDILKKVKADHLFDVIITGHDIKRGKPEPDVFLTAAEKLGLTPDTCVVFEDAVLGVEAAKRANMKCVGIDRYEKPERLQAADIVVSDLAEVTFEQIKGLII